jgi:Flp pilus assembly protein CpaB
MVDLLTSTPRTPTPPTPPSDPLHVRRRRPLPSGRAVVGGLLVTLAAVGAYAAAGTVDDHPSSAYAVVTADVAAGAQLDAGDLDLVPLDLPAAQRRVSFTDLGVLDGATALGPLGAGQLVQSSDVAKPFGGPGLASISMPVEPARALNGDLQRGDRVDVIVTTDAGAAPATTTVTTAAVVVDVVAPDQGLGVSGEVAVTLAVPPEDLEALAQAGATGTVTLARTTGVAPTG